MPAIHRPCETAHLIRRQLGPGPHPVADLVALGLTRGQIRAGIDACVLVRVRRGVLGLAHSPATDVSIAARVDHERRLHRDAAVGALATFGPTTFVSHESSAFLQMMPTMVPAPAPDMVSVTSQSQARTRRGVRTHSGTVDPADVVDVDGVPCTSVARTALDLARGRPLRESLVVLDAAAARSGPQKLAAGLNRLPWRYGLTELRRAVALCDPRSESPLESASRGAMIEADLPVADLQAWIRDDEGHWHRVDFLWAAQRLIGEADGWGKYAGRADLRAEKRREDSLRRIGYRFVRWTSDEVWPRPDTMIRRVRGLLL